MSFVRRYWAAALILSIVVVHAAVIGYVRSRVSRLQTLESNTVDMGRFRFQNALDKSKVYQFQLHAVLDPDRRRHSRDRIGQSELEIHEDMELLLRQVELDWLKDPEHSEIRERMMDIVAKRLEEPLIKRVIIIDWLELPVGEIEIDTAHHSSVASAKQ